MRFVNNNPRINVQIAHIRGAKLGSARYNETMSDEERRDFANLILLCKPCHDIVDIVERNQHTRERLEQWKSDREALGMAGLRALGGITEERLQELISETLAIQLGQVNEATRLAALERDTALELQDELFKFGRAFGSALHADEGVYRSTGKWGVSQLPPGLSDELLRATTAINQLRVRLADEEVNAQFTTYVDICTRAMIQNPAAGTDADRQRNARSLSSRATDLHAALNERLGQILRGQ